MNIEKIIKEIVNKPVYVRNDGMCAGLAEKEYGSLKNCNNGVFLGLGTGIGTAIFIGGRLEESIRSAGHMIIEKDGRRCKCGKYGCFEAYASMKTLKTQIRERLMKEDLSSEQILELLQNRITLEHLEDIINEYISYLAVGISNISRLCSAEVLSIGGSFVHYKDVLFDRLQRELDKIMLPMEKEMTKITLAELGNDAGIIGATLI